MRGQAGRLAYSQAATKEAASLNSTAALFSMHAVVSAPGLVVMISCAAAARRGERLLAGHRLKVQGGPGHPYQGMS